MSPQQHRRAICRSTGRAFTLVELLVVIGIIAILISILLPSLSKARKQARRTQCLSNQRQIAMAILMYANKSNGWLPPFNGGISNTRIADNGAYRALGLLYSTKVIAKSSVYYCPERTAAPDSNYVYQPEMWVDPPPKKIDISYLYRVSDDSGNGLSIPVLERNQLNALKLGKLRLKDKYGTKHKELEIAITSDLMGTRDMGAPDADWAHARPWGANVGFSDGHAEWIVVPQSVCLIPRTKWPANANTNVPNEYIWLMFKAFDTKDFTDVIARYP